MWFPLFTKKRWFFCLIISLVSLGCAHLRTDHYPLGLGNDSRAYVSIPAEIGGGIGMAGGAILALGLTPITLPTGYLMKGSGGAFVFWISPIIYMGYFVGALLGSPFYFLSLPFRESPLYSRSPQRRFFAIQETSLEEKKNIDRLFLILEKDLPELQLEAALRLGKSGKPKILKKMLEKTVNIKEEPLISHYLQGLKASCTSKNLAFWLSISQKVEGKALRVSLWCLSQYKNIQAWRRLVELMKGSQRRFAYQMLKKTTQMDLGPYPKAWEEWLHKYEKIKHKQ